MKLCVTGNTLYVVKANDTSEDINDQKPNESKDIVNSNEVVLVWAQVCFDCSLSRTLTASNL